MQLMVMMVWNAAAFRMYSTVMMHCTGFTDIADSAVWWYVVEIRGREGGGRERERRSERERHTTSRQTDRKENEDKSGERDSEVHTHGWGG